MSENKTRVLSASMQKECQRAAKLTAVMDVIKSSIDISLATQDLLKERFYQVYDKGYTVEKDSEYAEGDLAKFGAMLSSGNLSLMSPKFNAGYVDKLLAKDKRERLIIAAAFILAEVEVMDYKNQKRGS